MEALRGTYVNAGGGLEAAPTLQVLCHEGSFPMVVNHTSSYRKVSEKI